MVNNGITLAHHPLENSAQKFPDTIAVVHGDQRLTYAELEQQVNRLANFLIKLEFQKSDRVGILYKNSFDYIIAYFAILKIGCAAVPLDYDSSGENLKYIINNCNIKCILSSRLKNKIFVNFSGETPSLKYLIFDQEVGKNYIAGTIRHFNLTDIFNVENSSSPEVALNETDLAAIFYTSGSTGSPKGVTLTHLNIISNTKSIVQYLKLTNRDKVLVVLPFHYCYGKSLLQTHMMAGGTVVLDNRFMFPNVVLETMKREKVTGFSGVPTTFYILLNRTIFAKETFPDLRYITQAGGAMAPSTIKKLIELLPDKKIYIMYGATEATARLSFLEPSDLNRKVGSIGKAIPGVELTIVNSKGECVKADEAGEIVARGSNIMTGYWNDPEETGRVLKNGGYFTGDLAKMDGEGYFYIVGRKKDMVKVKGKRFSPSEVEECIIQHQDVEEVAVIGIDDQIHGEAIKAFIVLHKGASVEPREISLFCSKVLPNYKIPKHYKILSGLPKNSSGKIMKEMLHKNY